MCVCWCIFNDKYINFFFGMIFFFTIYFTVLEKWTSNKHVYISLFFFVVVSDWLSLDIMLGSA